MGGAGRTLAWISTRSGRGVDLFVGFGLLVKTGKVRVGRTGPGAAVETHARWRRRARRQLELAVDPTVGKVVDVFLGYLRRMRHSNLAAVRVTHLDEDVPEQLLVAQELVVRRSGELEEGGDLIAVMNDIAKDVVET